MDENGFLTRDVERQDGDLTSETEYEYDEEGRLLVCRRTGYEDGSVVSRTDHEYVYDEHGSEISFTESTYDEAGAVVSVRTETKTYAYDDEGRVTSRVTVPENGEYGSSVTKFEYDEEGRLVRKEEKSAEGASTVAEYGYEKGRLALFELKEPGGAAISTSFRYDRKGAVKSITKTKSEWNVYTTSVEYDRGGNIISVYDEETFLSYEMAYDENGDLLTREVSRDGIVLSTSEYEYDGDGNVSALTVTDQEGTSETTLFRDYVYYRERVEPLDPIEEIVINLEKIK